MEISSKISAISQQSKNLVKLFSASICFSSLHKQDGLCYIEDEEQNMDLLTSHSLWPWQPSWFSRLTAMTIPVPDRAGARVCSSTHPLKTEPKPPSPKTLSGLKFRVAVLRSLKVKLFTFDDSNISPSDLGLCGAETDETLLLPPLKPFLSFPENCRFDPDICQSHETHQYGRCSILLRQPHILDESTPFSTDCLAIWA